MVVAAVQMPICKQMIRRGERTRGRKDEGRVGSRGREGEARKRYLHHCRQDPHVGTHKNDALLDQDRRDDANNYLFGEEGEEEGRSEVLELVRLVVYGISREGRTLIRQHQLNEKSGFFLYLLPSSLSTLFSFSLLFSLRCT